MASNSVSDVADYLLSRGQVTASTEEIARLLGIPSDQVRHRLRNQVIKNLMFSPARGLWIPIPPQYRTWGSTPALDFIDALTRHLNREYYVGWLSAAEIFGASHQRPQVTQAATDRQLNRISIGRVRIEFYYRQHFEVLPRQRLQTKTGKIWISTPELTLLDLVDTPARGGGVSNVATLIHDLSQEVILNTSELIRIANIFPAVTLRRLGYLAELTDSRLDIDVLHHVVKSNPLKRNSMLSPLADRKGLVNTKWNLILNETVEPEI